MASRIGNEVLNGTAPTTYQYDKTDQLTNDSLTTFAYDLNGNRNMAGYSTGLANLITSDGTWNYNYDRNLNLIQMSGISNQEVYAFTFDNRNRMASASETTNMGLQMQATYVHDAIGQRVEKDVNIEGTSTVIRSAYDNGQIWVDLNGSNVLQTRYLRTDRAPELLARVSSGGIIGWNLVDRIGSLRYVTDDTGTVIAILGYDGFGNIVLQTSSANSGVYLYAGYRFDAETGFFRPDLTTGRLYGPWMAQWNGNDPILIGGNDPNFRRYVGNNAPNEVDLSGLADKKDTIPLSDFTSSLGPRPIMPIGPVVAPNYLENRLTPLRFGLPPDSRRNRKGIATGYFFSGTMDKSISGDNAIMKQLHLYSNLDKASKHYDVPLIYLLGTPVYHDVGFNRDVEAAEKAATVEWNKGNDIVVFGFSRGGVLAIELAKRLAKRGITVKYLGVIDPVGSYFNGYRRTLPRNCERINLTIKKNREEAWLLLNGLLTTENYEVPRGMLLIPERIVIDVQDFQHNGLIGFDINTLISDAKKHGVKLATPPAWKMPDKP